MARTSNKVSDKQLIQLRKDVVSGAGFPIQNPIDCEKLSELIFRKTKLYISAATLKRFLGFYKSEFNPSYQTLEILTIFCGYKGWVDYINPNKQLEPVTNEELTFFKTIFNLKDYSTISDHDETMQMISRRIAERLREDPKSFESILPDLAKNKLAQVFYFEHFPDYDNLVSYQYKGYIEYLKNKKTAEAQVFGNCILFFGAFLKMDEELMRKYHHQLMQLEIPENIHPMPLGRYYQCLILFQHFVEKKKIDKTLKHIFATEKRLPRIGTHFTNFPGFHYFIADALVLTGYYNDALKIIQLATNNYKIYREFVWKGYYRQLQLMMAECYLHLNNKSKSIELVTKINVDNFYFISRKYFTVRRNLLLIELAEENKELEKMTQELIAKHNFLVLNNLRD
jgi:hypothetical protein